MCKRRRNKQASESVHNPIKPVEMPSSNATKEEQLAVWDAAVKAARRRVHRPTPEDVLIPWAHGSTASSVATEVCTAAPFPAANRITLFLRTTLRATEIAHKLHREFYSGMKLTVKVTEELLLPYQSRGIGLKLSV